MARARQLIAWLGLSVAAGCGASQPPPVELSGLWSASQPACEAGVGVEFGAEAIDAVYENERQTLFLHPRYTVEGVGDAFRVRIADDPATTALTLTPCGAHPWREPLRGRGQV
jgi:hypothetical protein